MWKVFQTNKKLDQLEDTKPHQKNYQFGEKDHNITDSPQCITKIILLTDFVILIPIFVRTLKVEGNGLLYLLYFFISKIVYF